jgi:hypothetical protein
MKNAGLLLGAIFLFAASASAQASANATSTEASSDGTYAFVPVAAVPATGVVEAASSPLLALPASGETADAADAAQTPQVQSVFQKYNWQAYVGYTFFRFYLTPQITNNMNGLNFGIVWYPGGKWFGPDGEFIATFGTYGPYTTKFVAGLGGGRVRWAAPHNLEVWAHGMAGVANFLPQTALGNQSSFVYEVGGGVDFNVHQKRLALRVSGDMVGTDYFSTHQYSPKISAGIVLKY